MYHYFVVRKRSYKIHTVLLCSTPIQQRHLAAIFLTINQAEIQPQAKKRFVQHIFAQNEKINKNVNFDFQKGY